MMVIIAYLVAHALEFFAFLGIHRQRKANQRLLRPLDKGRKIVALDKQIRKQMKRQPNTAERLVAKSVSWLSKEFVNSSAYENLISMAIVNRKPVLKNILHS